MYAPLNNRTYAVVAVSYDASMSQAEGEPTTFNGGHAFKQSVLDELDRISGSSPFVNASRSSTLLRFLVLEALEGRSERLKEYVLGVEALGRPEKFDPRLDPIARVEVSRLRNKLDLYYATLPGQPPVRISLPKGTYVPEFSVQNTPERQAHRAPRLTFYVAASVAGDFLAGIFLTFVALHRPDRHQPMRVSVLPPRHGEINSIAISPDGESIAMAASVAGNSHLYLRRIAASFAPVLLAGTEDASFPFWSPDCRAIAFFAQRKLKVVELNGGEPRAVADAPLGRGGAWTNDDQIIFAPGALGSLIRVPAKGGNAVPFTVLNQAKGEVSHLWPVLLPGERLAYLAQRRDPALDAVFAVPLNAPGRPSRVVAANSSFAFSRSGKDRLSVLFLRDGALVEQHLSLSQLSVVDESATIARELKFDPLDRYADVSASLSSVAFVPGTPFRFYLQWINRDGGEAESLPGDGDYYALRISPDGSHLLTNQTDSRTGSTGVWSFDLIRKTDTPLTTGGVDFFPIWSPDGLKVAFAKSDGTAERGMRLTIVPTAGGDSRIVMDVHGPVFPSDWSNDASLLAYTGYQPLAEVTVVSIHDGTATKVWSYSPAAHSAGGAVFKPSPLHERPRWIAYTSDESGRDEVYLQSLEADRAKVQVSVSGGNRPLWRRDGRELYFVNAREELCAVSFPENSANFGTPHALFKLVGSLQAVPPYTLDYVASLDGQRFLIRRVDPDSEPSVINLIR